MLLQYIPVTYLFYNRSLYFLIPFTYFTQQPPPPQYILLRTLEGKECIFSQRRKLRLENLGHLPQVTQLASDQAGI